jgi:hypothetical protein
VRRFLSLLSVAGVALFASTAHAATITDVITNDVLIASASQDQVGAPSDANEAAWMFAQLNLYFGDPNYSDGLTYTKVEPGSSGDAGDWDPVDGTDWWAFDFGPLLEPVAFLVKTGGPSTATTFFLYANLDALRYAVVSLSDFTSAGTVTVGVISHLSYVEGQWVEGQREVNEPVTLALFGLGLLGGVYRLRRRFA